MNKEELCRMLDTLSDEKLEIFICFLKSLHDSNGKGERE